MGKRTTVALGLTVCACMCWAIATATAGEAAQPIGKKVVDPRSQFAVPPNPIQLSEEQLRINEQSVDTRDRSFLLHRRPRDITDVLPTWPAVAPMGSSEREAAGLRDVGPAHCAFEPCEVKIYSNIGGNSIGSFGDPDNVPLCDDVNFSSDAEITERFVCRVDVSVGGLANSTAIDVLTFSMRSGNFLPICPDDPLSLVLFCTTRNYVLQNGPGILSIEIDPPILVDSDFVWICLQSDNAQAAWSIATTAEIGLTEDDIVIPNTVRVWPNCEAGNGGTGFCEDLGPGQADDYFFYGGPPTIAGMYIEIFANPGPLGACCNRDVMPATCADNLTRANCVQQGSTYKWKEGVCADFDDTQPACVTCMTDADACSGATVSAEPNCGPGYVDTFNQGCDVAPNAFESISCGQSICGTAGTHQSFCTQDTECNQGIFCVSGACDGPDDSRDTDWYQIVLTQDTNVTVSLTARFDVQMTLMDNGGSSQNCTAELPVLDFRSGRTCETLTINRCLPAGTWWVRVRTDVFAGVLCNTKYRISLACGSCSLPVGACCDDSLAGCTELAQVACEGRGGFYEGNGTTCAVEGADCPGVPANDDCDGSKPVLTSLAVMLTFDTSFASDTDLIPAGQDVPAACEFGLNSVPLPAIKQDVFYNYRIPTSYSGVAVTSGIVVISTFGPEATNEGGGGLDTFLVVYGDAVAQGGTQPCGATLCDDAQIACSDDRLNDGTEFKKNTQSHIELVVEQNSANFFDPGDCIKIRVGRGRGAVVPSRPLGGPGQLNIDFIPTGPAPYLQGAAGTGRCCYYNPVTEAVACQIVPQDSNCVDTGGMEAAYRQFTDFNQGDPAGLEDYAGCKSDPCPKTGEACYTALVLSDGVGGGVIPSGSGTITRDVHGILWSKYVVPNGVSGVLVETCGSDGFFNPILGIYTASALNNSTGDCDLLAVFPTRLALQDDCTADQASATVHSNCIGALNFTSNSCACINVSGGETLYIAFGSSNTPGGQFEFTGSPRPIIRPATDPLDEPLHLTLTVQARVDPCVVCTSTCPGGSISESEDFNNNANCDTTDPGTIDAVGPQDLYNGGCFASPPTFNGPTIACSTTPVRVCGRAGNFRHPYPCDSPGDCPNSEPCSGVGGACDDASFINRDTDWYKMTVTTPSTIRWKVVSMEFAPEIAIIGDPLGDCFNGGSTVAFDALTFPCEPPSGTPNTLEVTAAVCAGTYYLYIAPNVFGGVGEAPCNAEYVVEATCEPFVQSAECCPGDMNNDGRVNGKDIRKWIDTLFFPPTLFDEFQGCFAANFCRGDVTGDGLLTVAADLPAFANLLVQSTKPVCPPVAQDCFDPATGQPPGSLETNETGAVESDLDLNSDFRAADCFCPLENGVITNICWWGTYVNVAGEECGPEKDCFKITFRNNNNANGRCPGTVIDPPGYQFLDSASAVVRTAGAAVINPTGSTDSDLMTEYLYTATLAVPVSVTAGQCLWIEIVNDTPQSDCHWYWETSPFGDTLHAQLDVAPPTGALPTDYSACNVSSEAPMDMAFSLGLRIDKEGCGTPVGRCCYDAAPLGTIDCVVTTQERCEILFLGEWTEGGSCPPSPACTLGRCCYVNPANQAQTLCVITMERTCATLDQASPQLAPAPGIWTAGVLDCSGGNVCPTGRCCVAGVCTVETQARCQFLGGSDFAPGTNCTGYTCSVDICDNAAKCQQPHLAAGVQLGGYVSDNDSTGGQPGPSMVADDFRPNANGSVSQLCWRGFHSTPTCGGGVAGAETFRIRIMTTTGSLPNTAGVLGTYNVTPTKSEPIPAEASGAPLSSPQYKYATSLVPAVSVSAGQCYWVEIMNTTVNASCVWLWATSNEGGNDRAAIANTGVVTPFAYQNVNRDLSFCVGPTVVLNNASCLHTPPVPTNNNCASAIVITTDNVFVVGSTIASTRDGTSGCDSGVIGGDVWYRYTTDGTDGTLLIELCHIGSTFDSIISLHTNVCPGTTATNVGGLCDDQGCATGVGTVQLFFPLKQARRQYGATLNDPNTPYLIRIFGGQGTGDPGGAKGVFRLRVTDNP